MAEPDLTSYKAFAGLRNDVAAERFASSDLAAANNVAIDKTGQVARRAGYTALLRNAAHSLWANPSGTTCLFARAGSLCALDTDYSATALAPLADQDARISFCETASSVYYANGRDTGVVEAGRARSWGLAVPPLPGVSLSFGSLPAGTYQFAMTYVRAGGQESGAPAAGVVDVPAGGGIAFVLPVSPDPDVVGKRVYLSPPNGDALYWAFEVPNAATTSYYQGDTLELSLPLDTQFLGPPPAGQLLGAYKGRMFVAQDDVLFYSEPFAYELFDLRNYIALDDRITLLAVLEEKDSGPGSSSGLFIGTTRSCGVLIGTDPDSFDYVPKTAYGAILGTLDYVDGSLYENGDTHAKALPMWLTTEGICVGLPGMEIKNLTRPRYGFQAAGEGAALFRPGPNQFIAVCNY